MNRRTITTFSALAVAGAITLGGAGVAVGADRGDAARSTGQATSAASDTTAKSQRGHRSTVTLTDGQVSKASTAALAKVPGTVEHVHAGRGGGYVVIVTRTDATKAVVKLDADFTVTSTHAANDRADKGTKDRATQDATKDRAKRGEDHATRGTEDGATHRTKGNRATRGTEDGAAQGTKGRADKDSGTRKASSSRSTNSSGTAA